MSHQSIMREISRSQSERYPQQAGNQIDIVEQEVQRSKSDRYQYQQNVQSKQEIELRKAKRKSNAHLAVEAVQQEIDAVRALKRLSMGDSLIMDPDLMTFDIENELQQRVKQHRRRSSSSSMSSISSEEDTTLIEDKFLDSGEDKDAKANAEKLLWVPAKAHPSIAPDQFRRHIQSTLNDMTNKKVPSEKSKESSIPSLKELTDELNKLSEIAGLAATDAVTLARSLSSTSSLYSDVETSPSSQKKNPSLYVNTDSKESSEGTSESLADQDSPILLDTSSLKRNQWTTYSRSRRGGRPSFSNRKLKSPLLDENKFSNDDPSHVFSSSESNNSSLSSDTSPSIPVKNEQLHEQPTASSPKQSRIHDQKPNFQPSLSRSQSDVTHSSPSASTSQSSSQSSSQNHRTNHSRNRHAGSLMTLDSKQEKERNLNDNHQRAQEQQKIHVSQQPYQQSHSRQSHPYQNISHKQNPQHIYQTEQKPSEPAYVSKKSSDLIIKTSVPSNSQDPSPTTQKFRSASSPTTFSSSYSQKATLPTTPTSPSAEAPQASLMEAAPILTKEKKESKSKDFLNIFKKKRSSPKILETVKRRVGQVTDEGSQLQSLQDESASQHAQNHQQEPLASVSSSSSSQAQSKPVDQRPVLKSSKLRVSKKDDTPKGLQDSVKIIPKREANEFSYRTGDPRAQEVEKRNKQQHLQHQQQQHHHQHQQQQQQAYQQQHHHQQQASQQQQEHLSQRSPPPPSPELNETTEQHRLQKESLSKKLSLENLKKSTKPNAPLQFTESAFGFPLPPLSKSTLVMLDHRFPIHVERALYRLSHLKLANPKRPLRQQVLLSNFMYAYLNLVNHTLYLQQLSEENTEEVPLDSL